MAIISSKKQPNDRDKAAAPADKVSVMAQAVSQAVSNGKPEKTTILQAEPEPEERSKQEEKIRPQCLTEYIGQKDLKDVLDIAIRAAKSRQEPLDHLLLYGPPGLGKTTMSLILAQEMGVKCKIASAPALERPRDIMGLLISLQPGDVLFIDEIHRLAKVAEELLYPAMEDFRVDIPLGKGKSAKMQSMSLPPFTLVGATTRVGALTSPLRDRFGLIQRLRFYEIDELTEIVLRTAALLKMNITQSGGEEIARRARGTPRIANRLLKRVRDFAEVKAFREIDRDIAAEALQLFNVDPCGLDWTDRRLLSFMIERHNGGPVGLETLAASTGEDAQTIEEVYEPYLMQIGYLSRTPRGRVATAAAWKHLGYTPPDTHQMTLLP
ncbi:MULTISPECIES: Holliday junction branch migration DNA helicase RuvB [Leptolyngbya]|uniref:Holliday junction branch migration DNA helicase RuvB n=2 Tax=Leptolyngbya group TaxID=3081713 RepID=UPI0016843EE6|nr:MULTISPECIES: Holliday junction branch migration DNA helicase RuvB [unclassified Leptolyngbya]MBD1859106.1 Holliday junction branch migration DNA helicase RuvB [Leptolyngbya sp. FACHB-1624]MCY6493739.1 Holliday junction branch migration DNA helicase RuvB [Leptolyngbya sp. GGD]